MWADRFASMGFPPQVFVLPYFVQWFYQEIAWEAPFQFLQWYWQILLKKKPSENTTADSGVYPQLWQGLATDVLEQPNSLWKKSVLPALFGHPRPICTFLMRQWKTMLLGQWALIPIDQEGQSHPFFLHIREVGAKRVLHFQTDWKHPTWQWVHLEGELVFPALTLNFFNRYQDFVKFVDSQKSCLADRLKSLKFERIRIRGFCEERTGQGLRWLIRQRVSMINRVG